MTSSEHPASLRYLRSYSRISTARRHHLAAIDLYFNSTVAAMAMNSRGLMPAGRYHRALLRAHLRDRDAHPRGDVVSIRGFLIAARTTRNEGPSGGSCPTGGGVRTSRTTSRLPWPHGGEPWRPRPTQLRSGHATRGSSPMRGGASGRMGRLSAGVFALHGQDIPALRVKLWNR